MLLCSVLFLRTWCRPVVDMDGGWPQGQLAELGCRDAGQEPSRAKLQSAVVRVWIGCGICKQYTHI